VKKKDLNDYADLALKSVVEAYLMYLLVDKGLLFDDAFIALGQKVGGICGDFIVERKSKRG